MKNVSVFFYILMLIVSVLLNACRDENVVDDYESDNKIAFIQIHEQVEALQTKAETILQAEPLELKDEGESQVKLFLHGSQSDGILFSRKDNSEETPQTKAMPIEEMYDRFKVFAQSYKADKPTVWTPNFINGIEVLKSENYTTNRYWPDAGTTIEFVAFAPSSGVILDPLETTPTFHYTVPLNVTEQYDLLFSTQQTTVSGGKPGKVPLKFKHVLTALKFVANADIKKGTISKITIKNIRANGRYNALSDAWTLSEKKFDFWVDLNKGVTPGASSAPITLPEQTFMLLPQVTSDDTMIEVEFTDSLTSTKRTLRAPLTNIDLQQGKTIVFKISNSNIIEETFFDFKWRNTANVVDYRGLQKLTLQWHSYAKSTYKGDEKESPLNWMVEYSVDNGTTWSASKPDMIENFQPQGLGSVTQQFLDLKIGPSPALQLTPLVDNPPVVDFNLSNSTGADQIENTANCYIIDRQGSYRIPLVYGNGIKNGQVNESAYYNPSHSTFTAHPRLWTHTGMGVTDPYIYNASIGENQQDKEPFDCVLVASTGEHLISDVKLAENKKELLFQIKRVYITQGNAIVAVRNKDKTIMWSWHIWVTPFREFMGQVKMRHVNRQTDKKTYYTALDFPLGWMTPRLDIAVHYSRNLQLRFTQIKTGKTIHLTANQLNRRPPMRGTSLLYQYGRKDPYPSEYGVNELKYYNGYSMDHKPHGQNVELSIQQPHVISNSSRPYRFVNLWDMAYADYNVADKLDVTKTIYDPSPVGYMVPPASIFDSFLVRMETETGDLKFVNLSHYETQNLQEVWTFLSSDKTTVYQIFFPTTGQYNTASTLTDTNSGFYWTAHPAGQTAGRSMRLDPTPYIRTFWDGSKERAMGVMPIKEEVEK